MTYAHALQKFVIIVCPMLCNAWTEYKFTCVHVFVSVCVCVRHSFCQLAYRSDPLTPLTLTPGLNTPGP